MFFKEIDLKITSSTLSINLWLEHHDNGSYKFNQIERLVLSINNINFHLDNLFSHIIAWTKTNK